jgi:hypothetical protein
MNDTRPGVKSLILLNSGRFDDAQIELDTCVNLVGANNVGKTSAITPLQFLYVGNLNEMSFGGKGLDETRRHYFPHPNSYIIFECLSADHGGYVSVGIRGLGAVRGYEFERFAYPGRYDRSHYVDEHQQMRDADQTKALIMAASGMYRVLDKAGDLTSMLCGQYEESALNLSFVPLKDSGARAMFGRLFKNLLFLRAMSQTDLKDTLVEVYRRALVAPVVNLRKNNEEQIQRLQAKYDQMQIFMRAASKIDAAAAHAQTLCRERQGLPDMHRRIGILKTFEEKTWSVAKRDAHQRLQSYKAELDDLDKQRDAASKAWRSAADRTMRLTTQIDAIDRAGNEFTNYVDTLEKASLDSARALVESLQRAILQIESEPLQNLQNRRANLQREHDEAQAKRDRFERLLASELSNAIGPEEAAKALSVLNASIAQIDIDQVMSLDPETFAASMRELAAGVSSDGSYRGLGLSLAPGQLVVQPLPSREALTEQIATTQESIKDIDRRIALAESKEALSARLAEATSKREQQSDRMRRYEQWQISLQQRPALTEAKLAAEAEESAAYERLNKLHNHGNVLNKRISEEKDQISKAQAELDRIRTVNPPEPPKDWPDDHFGRGEGEPLVPLADSYRQSWNQAHQAQRDLEAAINDLERDLQDGLDGETPLAKLDDAIARKAGLADEKTTFEQEWSALLVSARASIEHILQDVQKLSDEVFRLNRRLAQVKISNLSGVTLRIVEQKDVMDQCRALLEGDLFSDDQDRKQALDQLANMIRGQNGAITLQQLFGVQIEVRIDGETRPVQFASLDAIESNGTMIMIKLLIAMILISDMLKRNRHVFIPYYVDEAPTLDAVNFNQVVQVSNEMGFVPILAGTTPSSCAKHFYFVRYVGSRKSIMERRQRLQRERVPEPDQTAA